MKTLTKTALMAAAENGNIQWMEELLGDPNTDVDMQLLQEINLYGGIGFGVSSGPFNGYTALMFASSAGHYQAVALLLEFYANHNLTNNDGLTALKIAKNNDQDEIALLLQDTLRKAIQLERFCTDLIACVHKLQFEALETKQADLALTKNEVVEHLLRHWTSENPSVCEQLHHALETDERGIPANPLSQFMHKSQDWLTIGKDEATLQKLQDRLTLLEHLKESKSVERTSFITYSADIKTENPFCSPPVREDYTAGMKQII